MAGYAVGEPEVFPVPSCWVMLNPLAVVLMHWVALVPHRLFMMM